MRRYSKKKEICFDTPEEERAAAVKKAMDLLLYRDRSRAELAGRLQEAGFCEEAVEAALGYVTSYGYLNDRRFAETFAAVRADRQSRAAIERELRQKGVAEEIIREVIEAEDRNDEDTAYELLCRKAGEPHPLEDRELRKLLAFLGRRGFGTGDAWRALQKYRDSIEQP